GAAFRHPRTAALAVTGIQVKVEPGQKLVAAMDVPRTDRVVPGFHFRIRGNGDAVEPASDLEQPLPYLWQRKIGSELFLGDGVIPLTSFFAVVGDIPGLQVGDAMHPLREFTQALIFVASSWNGQLGELLEKVVHPL